MHIYLPFAGIEEWVEVASVSSSWPAPPIFGIWGAHIQCLQHSSSGMGSRRAKAGWQGKSAGGRAGTGGQAALHSTRPFSQ